MNDNLFSLAGTRALVIGGGSGIGQALAVGLGAAGAAVHVAGRRPRPLEETVEAIRGAGGRADAVALDVTDLDALEALVRSLEEAGALPDILVNAQGLMMLAKSEEFSEADYDRIMDTNLKSVWFASTRFGRRMLARGSGSIISVASMSSFRGFPGNGVYCLSKHGVRALTETLAAEWAGRGVRVNAIAPGFFLTDLNRSVMDEERKTRVLSRTPMQRFGRLDELVGAAVYLASPAAGYVTGTTIAIDGGFLAMGV